MLCTVQVLNKLFLYKDNFIDNERNYKYVNPQLLTDT